MTLQEMTLPQIDDEIIMYLNKMKDPEISTEEKQELRKKVNFLEQHMQNVNAKMIQANTNKMHGKVYPSLVSDHFGYTPEEKEELLQLIDSV